MLSVIVPCYNSGPYIARLLDSLVKQHYADMEVVLADDCSPEPYADIVKPYEDKLKIVWTKTEYNCCPGNTRQAGVDAASGDWITFSDHDDAWYPGAISKVMQAIKKNPGYNAVLTDFDEVEPKTDKVLQHDHMQYGWTHGKFYRRSWWDKHKLRYKKDLLSHEDIYIGSLVNCALFEDNQTYLYVPVTTYKWTAHPESVSRSEDRCFIENHFEEWLQATGYVYLDFYRNGGDYMFCAYHTLLVFLYCYFYIMGFMFHDPKNYLKENPGIAGAYMHAMMETLEETPGTIFQAASAQHGSLWLSVERQAEKAVGGYIPCMSFHEFMAKLSAVPKE